MLIKAFVVGDCLKTITNFHKHMIYILIDDENKFKIMEPIIYL